MNGLSNLNETYREYSQAPTDDLIRLWRSKVKFTAGCEGGKGTDVEAGHKSRIFLILRYYYLVAQVCCRKMTEFLCKKSRVNFNWKMSLVTKSL